jgi:hypothetical protein
MNDQPNLFILMVTSLVQMALTYLGELETESEAKPKINMEAARETIDTLIMLRTKTKNNLTSEEDQLLDEAIYQLQRTFVQKEAKPK